MFKVMKILLCEFHPNFKKIYLHMKAKILMVVILMSFSTLLIAQQPSDLAPKKKEMSEKFARLREMRGERMNQMRGPGNGLNLTDVQKEAFKKSMLTVHKQLQPLRNELGEAVAHQKSLVTAEKPDFNAINKNIEKIGELRVQMAKIETKARVELRAQLTDEQRLKFDMFKGMKKGGKMNRGKRI